jgi:serine protease Do
MKSITKILLTLCLSFLLTNCASILNGKHQKVTVKTNSSDSKVYIDNELSGKGKSVVTKMKRDAMMKQIKIERDGYKPIYKIHYQTKKSPLHILSWVPFGVLWIPPFVDYGPKSFNYNKEINCSAEALEIKTRKDDEKYVYLKNTAFDLKKEDIKLKSIKHKSFKKSKNKYKEKEFINEDIKFDNSIFSESVTEILKENNYIDTTQTIFKSKINTLYISSKITKLDIENVWSISAKRYQNFFVSKMEIEWEIFDLYGQSKYKKSFKATSGEFAAIGNEFLKNCIQDAISESFYKFMDSKDVRALIKKENEEKIKYDILNLQRGELISNIEDAMNSTVTIKVKDGHGSGCVVSKDGYIVTNFHVVANSDKLTVVDREGIEHVAKLIRKNENLDLALIKVENVNFKCSYIIPNSKNYSIGDDIFVIGTPTSVELGQTLSKGIISGNRTFDQNNFIQTDASVNGGNSGGALTKKSGELIGIINAKISGLGVEGLGFSIPAELITSGLFITN